MPTRRKQASPQTGPATTGIPAAIPAKADQSSAIAYPVPIISPAMDTGRGPRPPRESAFSLREPAQLHREALGKRRWRAFGGAVVSLAAISFAMGMLAGRGEFRAFAEIFGRDNVAARASAGTTGPTSANSDFTERSSPSGKIPNEPANNFAATPRNQRATSQVLTLHHSRPGHSDKRTSRQDSSAMLNLPENLVSASASVAIRTRRSIPLPPETRTANSQSGQNLQIGALISKTEPAYPQDTRDQKIEGTVRLHAWIGEDGNVRRVDVLEGPFALAAGASNAVRAWRYASTLYDGQPIATEEDIIVGFRLPH